MIVCTSCGNHNADADEFCGSCGKFLEWVGQKIEDPKPVEAAAEPEAVEPEKHGLIDRVKAAVGIEGSAGSDAVTTSDPAGRVDLAVADSPAQATPNTNGASTSASASSAPPADGGSTNGGSTNGAAGSPTVTADAPSAPEVDEELEREAAAATAAAAEAREEAERQQRAAEEAARDEARRQAEAEAAAKAAAEEQARLEAASRRAAEEAAAAEAARKEAEATQLASEERARLEEQAKQAAEEAAAAETARKQAEAEEEARRQREAAEAARAQAEAEEAAKRAAQAEEMRQRAEAERQRKEAEARAEAARRAAALLAQPKPAAATPPSGTPTPPPPGAAATPVAPSNVPSAPPVAPSSATPPAAPAAPASPPPGAPQTPVAPVAPAAVAPSQAPAKPKAPPKPATQTAVDDGPKPGDLICSSCGTGNDPSRKFCRRCGNSLAQAAPVKKVPWWKRLFQKKPRGQQGKGRKAVQGARQASFKAEMAMARLRNVAIILAMAGVGVGFMVPSIRVVAFNTARGGIEKARDTLFPSFSNIRPIESTATSELPDHPAAHARDLIVNTYWAEAVEGDGIGQTISFTFAESFELGKVIITPGSIDQNQPDLFLKNPRPKVLHLVFDNGASTDLTLEDEPNKAQSFTVKGGKGITKVDISISEVFPGSGGADTALAEVEFKKRG